MEEVSEQYTTHHNEMFVGKQSGERSKSARTNDIFGMLFKWGEKFMFFLCYVEALRYVSVEYSDGAFISNDMRRFFCYLFMRVIVAAV